jgi:hypothetical protein
MFHFLKAARTPGFPGLATMPDMDRDGTADTFKDRIRYFFQSCGTDREEGTHYRALTACMRQYLRDSRHGDWAYTVGPHAVEAPAGTPLADMQRLVHVDHLRYYVSNAVGVIMGIGWYAYDPVSRSYRREGGHFFVVYGYDFNHAWGNSRLTLKVSNNWVDYSGRARDQMFDHVEMTAHPTGDGNVYPAETAFRLQGTGFDFASYTAFVEDIFVAAPVPP